MYSLIIRVKLDGMSHLLTLLASVEISLVKDKMTDPHFQHARN